MAGWDGIDRMGYQEAASGTIYWQEISWSTNGAFLRFLRYGYKQQALISYCWNASASPRSVNQDLSHGSTCKRFSPVDDYTAWTNKYKNACCAAIKMILLFVFATPFCISYSCTSWFCRLSAMWILAALVSEMFWMSSGKFSVGRDPPDMHICKYISQGCWCLPPTTGVFGQQVIRLNLAASMWCALLINHQYYIDAAKLRL